MSRVLRRTAPPAELLAIPALLGGMASVQVGASIAKSLFPIFGAAGTAGLRIGLSLLVLTILWRPWRHVPDAAALRAIVPYGAALGIMNLLFYLAVARLPLGTAVAIEFTGPLALAFAASRRLLDLLWATLVVIGLALLLGPLATARAAGLSIDRLGIDKLGAVFALGAGLCWALYIVFGHRVGRRVAGGQATMYGMGVATLVVAPFCVRGMVPAFTDPRHLGEALLVAVLSSALPYSLEMAAMRRMSARSFGIMMSIEPALAACAGLIFLGEQLSASRWLGILCVVAASAGTALAGMPRGPDAP